LNTQFYDTATHPLMRRGEYWLDEVCARHLGVFGKTYVNSNPLFFGRMQRTADQSYVVTQLACSAGTGHRRPQDVRRWTHDASVISIQRGKGAIWRQRGRELMLRAGDMIVTNPDEPYDMATDGDFDLVSFFVPRSLLTTNLFPGNPDRMRVLPREQPACDLAARFGMDLAGRIAELPSVEAQGMVDAMARLVAVAAGAAAPAHGAALRQARLAQARFYIEQNMGDPDLTPAGCAKALGVSVRALHMAFEPAGESFSQVLQQCRLERCIALLRNPAAGGRAVSDIAFACGFGSLAGFYRAFSRTYGASPTDMRAEAA
jgi:AraC-like DNA-binding protein